MNLSILNPWVLLSLLAAFLGVAGGSYGYGKKIEHTAVVAAWDAAEKQRAWESLRNLERVRDTEGTLQARAADERTKNATLVASLNARVELLNARLRERPARPVEPAAVDTAAAGPGAPSWATGAGLYRDDGLFLAGKAALWQQIRLQRDTCYRSYEAAQAELARLNGSRQPGGAP